MMAEYFSLFDQFTVPPKFPPSFLVAFILKILLAHQECKLLAIGIV